MIMKLFYSILAGGDGTELGLHFPDFIRPQFEGANDSIKAPRIAELERIQHFALPRGSPERQQPFPAVGFGMDRFATNSCGWECPAPAASGVENRWTDCFRALMYNLIS